MKTTTQVQAINGKLTKTQTIRYSNGDVVKRIYDKVMDIVPSDIILVTFGKHVGKANV
jgi:hypothetical protein